MLSDAAVSGNWFTLKSGPNKGNGNFMSMMQKFNTSKSWQIQYSIFDQAEGPAILFFHGFPGSHVQAEFLRPYAAAQGVLVIAVDRPGYGGTTALPSGTPSVREYAQGVIELLESLHIRRFHVLGVSGGAPLSWLLSSWYPDRVQALGIVCGLCSYGADEYQLFSRLQKSALLLRRGLPEGLLHFLVKKIMQRMPPQRLINTLKKFVAEEDQKLLVQPRMQELLLSSMTMARAQGPAGLLWDVYLYGSDWLGESANVKALSSLPIFLWHGAKDNILPYQMSQLMQSKFPQAVLKIYPDMAHYSLPIFKAEEILHQFTRPKSIDDTL